MKSVTPEYNYYLKDHLGNTRVVFNDNDQVLQQHDYYPFGMEISGQLGGDIKYRYNGKELQDESIGGVGLDWYDYGARFYDAALGRWSTLDPQKERGYEITPYNFTFNNPLNFVDPDGEWPWEDSNVRSARRFARKNGLKLHTWKSERTGRKWAYVHNGNSGETKVFKPGTNRTAIGNMFNAGDQALIRAKGNSEFKWEGDNNPANSSSEITKQDVAVGTGVIGVMLGGYALIQGETLVLSILNVLNSADDIGTDEKGESLTQQMTDSNNGKKTIGFAKKILSSLGIVKNTTRILSDPSQADDAISGINSAASVANSTEDEEE